MTQISAQELKARMDAGEKLNIIDVREPNEYQQFNIGAKLVPLGKITGMQIEELEDLKDQEVIIHCHAGSRSMQACMFLEQMGFTNTVNLTGGMVAWKQLN